MDKRIDDGISQVYDLYRTGYISKATYDEWIDKMGELYGAEYIASRMTYLGL